MIDKTTRLFAVDVEGTIMIVADDARWAELEAGGYLSDESSHMSCRAREVVDLGQVDQAWLDSMPYGDNGEEDTCREIYAKICALKDDPRQTALDLDDGNDG